MKTKITLIFSAVLLLIVTSLNLSAQSPSNVHSFTYDGRNYEVVKEMETYSNAASVAVTRGGYLAEINSQEEQDSVYNAITNIALVTPGYTTVSDGGGIAYVWIGASDLDTEGTWLWDGDNDNAGTNFWNGQGSAGSGNGSAVAGAYINWGGSSSGAPNEPDDYGTGQDAAAIALSGWPAPNPGMLGIAGEWNDIDHTNSLYYVIEYDCGTTTSEIDVSECYNYTAPSGNNTWTTSGTYYDTVQNAGGCDSIITVNLSIENPDTTVTNTGSNELMANQSGADYQWLDCNNNYAQISGASQQTFSPNGSGSYAVELTIGGCIDTSNCHNLTVGTSDIFEDKLEIYPNPADGILNINASSLNDCEIIITDINGRQMYSRNNVKDHIEINTEKFKPGVYFISVSHNESIIRKKILIK